MAWWVWVLVGWVTLASGAGVVLGLAIRTAERRELGEDRPDGPEDDVG